MSGLDLKSVFKGRKQSITKNIETNINIMKGMKFNNKKLNSEINLNSCEYISPGNQNINSSIKNDISSIQIYNNENNYKQIRKDRFESHDFDKIDQKNNSINNIQNNICNNTDNATSKNNYKENCDHFHGKNALNSFNYNNIINSNYNIYSNNNINMKQKNTYNFQYQNSNNISKKENNSNSGTITNNRVVSINNKNSLTLFNDFDINNNSNNQNIEEKKNIKSINQYQKSISQNNVNTKNPHKALEIKTKSTNTTQSTNNNINFQQIFSLNNFGNNLNVWENNENNTEQEIKKEEVKELRKINLNKEIDVNENLQQNKRIKNTEKQNEEYINFINKKKYENDGEKKLEAKEINMESNTTRVENNKKIIFTNKQRSYNLNFPGNKINYSPQNNKISINTNLSSFINVKDIKLNNNQKQKISPQSLISNDILSNYNYKELNKLITFKEGNLFENSDNLNFLYNPIISLNSLKTTSPALPNFNKIQNNINLNNNRNYFDSSVFLQEKTIQFSLQIPETKQDNFLVKKLHLDTSFDSNSKLSLSKTIAILHNYINTQKKVFTGELEKKEKSISELKDKERAYNSEKISLLKENNKLKSLILDMISKVNSVEIQKTLDDKEIIVIYYLIFIQNLTSKLTIENKALRYLVHYIIPFRDQKETTTNNIESSHNYIGKNQKTGVKNLLTKKESLNLDDEEYFSLYENDSVEKVEKPERISENNNQDPKHNYTKVRSKQSNNKLSHGLSNIINNINNSNNIYVLENNLEKIDKVQRKSTSIKNSLNKESEVSSNRTEISLAKTTSVKHFNININNNLNIKNDKKISIEENKVNIKNTSIINNNENATYSNRENLNRNEINSLESKGIFIYYLFKLDIGNKDKLSSFIKSAWNEMKNDNISRRNIINNEMETSLRNKNAINNENNENNTENTGNNTSSSSKTNSSIEQQHISNGNFQTETKSSAKQMFLFYRTPSNKDNNKKILFFTEKDGENKSEKKIFS